MKRTAGRIIGATLLQGNKVPHHINYLRGVQDLMYNILRYHLLLVDVILGFIYSLSHLP